MNEIHLELLEGAWESVNLDASVIIYHHFNGKYYLVIVYINIYTKQAHPAVHEIYEENNEFFFGLLLNKQKLEYNHILDTLILSSLGKYQRV